MLLVQFSAAQGPLECSLATEKGFSLFIRSLIKQRISYEILEINHDQVGYKSALVRVDIDLSHPLISSWEGSHLWICQSPLRIHHKRKNWFFGVQVFELPKEVPESEISYQAVRAQGPGGQHVNKTATAIQAIHLATGITVKVQTERSQYANLKIAARLIAYKLNELHQNAIDDAQSERRYAHFQVSRGDPKRTFKGVDFKEI